MGVRNQGLATRLAKDFATASAASNFAKRGVFRLGHAMINGCAPSARRPGQRGRD